MRRILCGVCLSAVLISAGCNNWIHKREENPQGRALTEAPNQAKLVDFLNENARRVQGMECLNVDMDVKVGYQTGGLSGRMAIQKPNNFRLIAKIPTGTPEADIGSNEQEFWYWIKRAEPPFVYHCSYDDFRKGNVRYMPFPFQPEWIMEALNISEYDPNKHYEVAKKADTIELSEQVVTPQGQRIRKVTVFNPRNVGTSKPQVTAHLLLDDKGKEICSAHITEVQVDRTTGAILPHKVQLVWAGDKNQERTEMRLILNDIRVGPIAPDRAPDLFARGGALTTMRSFDLARGPDGQANSLQRVRGQRP